MSYISHAYEWIDDNIPRSVLALLVLAIGFRLAIWQVTPPNWRLFMAAQSVELSFVEYCADFVGRITERLPFIDWISGRIWLATQPVLGEKGLSLLHLVLSCISLPFGYLFARNIVDESAAFYSFLFIAFYPKYIWMSGTGMPEAASLAMLLISLYYLSQAFQAERYRSFVLAGVWAAFAYLTFLPSILYLVLAGVFILVKYRKQLLQGVKNSLSYGSTGIVAVSLHYMSGALTQLIVSNRLVTPVRDSIFVVPSQYPLWEKIGRYTLYSFFDFWSHTTGFDWEKGILDTVDIWKNFVPLPTVSASIWFCSAILLTIPVFFGLRKAFGQVGKDEWLTFILGIFCTYWLIWWYKAIFNPGLETRHVFPQVAFIAILFGIGATEIRKTLDYSKKTLLSVISFAFAVLLLTASFGAIQTHAMFQATREQPVSYLESAEEPKKVAVTGRLAYKYSEILSPELDTYLITPHVRPQISASQVARMNYNTSTSYSEVKEQGFDYLLVTYWGDKPSSQYKRKILREARNSTIFDEKYRTGRSKVIKIS